jgi:hypothetical protein
VRVRVCVCMCLCARGCLELLLHAVLSYNCRRPYATRVCGLKLLFPAGRCSQFIRGLSRLLEAHMSAEAVGEEEGAWLKFHVALAY